jgi:hypothetical protein
VPVAAAVADAGHAALLWHALGKSVIGGLSDKFL